MSCHTTVHPCRWPPRGMKYMYSTIHPLFSNIKICPFYFKNLTKTSKISKIHGTPGWNHNSEMWGYCAIGVQERQIQGPMEVIPQKIMSITIDSRTLFEKNKGSVFSEWTVVCCQCHASRGECFMSKQVRKSKRILFCTNEAPISCSNWARTFLGRVLKGQPKQRWEQRKFTADLCDEGCVRCNDLLIWVMTGENRNTNKSNTVMQPASAFRYDAERL